MFAFSVERSLLERENPQIQVNLHQNREQNRNVFAPLGFERFQEQSPILLMRHLSIGPARYERDWSTEILTPCRPILIQDKPT